MKNNRKYIFLLMALILSLITPPVSADNKQAVLNIAQPETNGKAVVLMDASSGRVLYENNSHDRLPPASVTKIMTALLVVENGEMDKKVIVSQHVADTPEATIYLEPGEVLSRMDLLYGAMLPSANDACMALAESVSGTEASFIALMNKRANELGMKDTHYSNPHGLQASGHYSSAYDLALLARKALSNELFARVVGTKQKQIPWTSRDEDRLLINQNRLLYRYDGTIGVKTGYTKEAGNCVVAAARKGTMTLIAVSLNSPTVYDDLEEMLDYGFDNYQMVTVAKSDQLSGEVKVIAGDTETVTIGVVNDVMIAAAQDEIPYLSYAFVPPSQVEAPVHKGDVLGICKVYIHGEQITALDLLADQSVDKRLPETFLAAAGQCLTIFLSKWYFYFLLIILLVLLYKRKKKISFEELLRQLLLRLLRKKISRMKQTGQIKGPGV